jgi:hypothetical protein
MNTIEERAKQTIEALKRKNKEEKNKEETAEENPRFPELAPNAETTLEEWREVIRGDFPELLFPAEVGLSVMAQLLIKDIVNPFALVYVDVPSSGKTIVLNFFSTIKELAYTSDDFTPASFVSHYSNTKRKDIAKNDLLPRIRFKTLLIRDLATIFAKRDEDVQAMLGILIRVLDGEGLQSDSGVYGQRGYEGDYHFMLMGASTQIRPRIWKIMGNLGSRLFFLNIDSKDKDEETLALQLENSCRNKEIQCRLATEEFLKTLWSQNPEGVAWDLSQDNFEIKKMIARFAKIISKLRGPVNVWRDGYGSDEENHTEPIIEKPDRLNQLLYNLARGHALICGRRKIGQEDLPILAKVALDSALPNRSKMIKALIRNGGSIGTSQAMQELKFSRPTVHKIMKEMVLVEIAEADEDIIDAPDLGRPEKNIYLKEELQWLLGEDIQRLIR